MKYKVFNSVQFVEAELRKQEKRHFEVMVELKVAEKMKDDKKILELKEELTIIESTINALNEL